MNPEVQSPHATMERLRLRAILLSQVREFFQRHGFWEVETPLLSTDLIVDREIEPIAAGGATAAYLQTSPEAHMKRLLARGAGAIFQITRSFRDDEQGDLHNREFTIVEWYRPGDDMAAGMSLLGDLCEAVLKRGPAELISFREAFQRHADVDPHLAEVAALEEAADKSGERPPQMPVGDGDAWLDYLMATRVAPSLGKKAPTIVYDYPASQAALAKIRQDSPPAAERFELFVDGIELANGYHEETSADELARRQAELHRQRAATGKKPLPCTSRWLDDIAAGLPDCTGVALGFDRMVMLAAGAKSIGEVMAFPADWA